VKKRWLGTVLMICSFSACAEEACEVLRLASLPIEYTSFKPTLHGMFNGVDLRLLMDSGATTTFLFPSGVKKAGLTEIRTNGLSVGVGGSVPSFIAVAKEAEIGPSHGKNVRFMAIETSLNGEGVLGADYLFRTDLEVFLRENRVTFLKTEHCDDKPISYWDHDAPWVDSHDVWGSDQRQKIEVKINGQRFSALLDSGAMQSVINLRAAASIGLKPDAAGTQLAGLATGIGGSVPRWSAHIDTFEIGAETVRNVTIQIADLYGPSFNHVALFMPDMILGADFMQAHRLLFSRSQGRLYFTYLGGQIFNPGPSREELAEKVQHMREEAEKNSVPDMLGLAYMLTMGLGAEKDQVEACKWLLIAEQSSWAASHAGVLQNIQRSSAALLAQLSGPESDEARKRAAAWTPLQ